MQVYKSFEPFVSVIMPTFNRKNYLQRAVDSVISQSFKSWELIIVDDGSNDGTYSVIDGYIAKNENIRYLKHSNRKPPLSLNAGILASCGKYVTFLNSDDEYKPDHLQKRIEYLEKNPGIDFLHGGIEIIGYPYVKDKNDLTREIHITECAVGGTFFGRKEIFINLGGFNNIGYSDDSEFLERSEKSYKVIKVNWSTYKYYRDTPDSICNTLGIK